MRITFRRRAFKAAMALPPETLSGMRAALQAFAADPNAVHDRIHALKGGRGQFRLDLETYRILYEINPKSQTILVTTIDPITPPAGS